MEPAETDRTTENTPSPSTKKPRRPNECGPKIMGPLPSSSLNAVQVPASPGPYVPKPRPVSTWVSGYGGAGVTPDAIKSKLNVRDSPADTTIGAACAVGARPRRKTTGRTQRARSIETNLSERLVISEAALVAFARTRSREESAVGGIERENR